jgi:hypothetical protein
MSFILSQFRNLSRLHSPSREGYPVFNLVILCTQPSYRFFMSFDLVIVYVYVLDLVIIYLHVLNLVMRHTLAKLLSARPIITTRSLVVVAY